MVASVGRASRVKPTLSADDQKVKVENATDNKKRNTKKRSPTRANQSIDFFFKPQKKSLLEGGGVTDAILERHFRPYDKSESPKNEFLLLFSRRKQSTTSEEPAG